MKRAVIIAKGEVQQVGYRDIVRKIARKLELTGFVENLEFCDVKIVAEGEEEALNTFVTQIKIEKYPVTVKKLDVEFSDATGEFEHFKIKRGDWRDELGERMDTAGALLYRSVELGEESVKLGRESVEIGRNMLGKQDQMIEKQNVMIEKQDSHTQILAEKMDTHNNILVEKMDSHTQILAEKMDTHNNILVEKMDSHTQILTDLRDQTKQTHQKMDVNTSILTDLRDQTQQSFEVLDVKYGKIAENMERIVNEMRDERKESRESMKGLTDAILELARTRK